MSASSDNNLRLIYWFGDSGKNGVFSFEGVATHDFIVFLCGILEKLIFKEECLIVKKKLLHNFNKYVSACSMAYYTFKRIR